LASEKFHLLSKIRDNITTTCICPDAIKSYFGLDECPLENRLEKIDPAIICSDEFLLQRRFTKYSSNLSKFEMEYKPRFEQAYRLIPGNRFDDQCARNDWNWKPDFSLKEMKRTFLENLPKFKNSNC